MKTKLFMLLLVALPFLNACKKPVEEESLAFTKLTVEQQKQKIEQNGLDFLNTVQKVETTAAYTAVMNLNSLMNRFITIGDPLANAVRQMAALKSVQPLQKSIVPQKEWGKWIWNPAVKDFEQGEKFTTPKVVYLFPSSETASTNDAEFTLNWTDSRELLPCSETKYLPATLAAMLNVKGVKAIDASFTGTYTAEGLPASVVEKLTVDKFQFNTNGVNTGTAITSDMALSYDSKKLLGYDFKSEGTFNKASFEKIENAPADVISNANLTLYAMNIGCVGALSNAKEFQTALNAADLLEKTDPKAAVAKRVEAANKYMKVFGYFVDENKKFADVEYYEVVETSPYGERHDVGVRFVLSDGSKVKADEYIQQGFQDLLDKINELVEKYQPKEIFRTVKN